MYIEQKNKLLVDLDVNASIPLLLECSLGLPMDLVAGSTALGKNLEKRKEEENLNNLIRMCSY